MSFSTKKILFGSSWSLLLHISSLLLCAVVHCTISSTSAILNSGGPSFVRYPRKRCHNLSGVLEKSKRSNVVKCERRCKKTRQCLSYQYESDRRVCRLLPSRKKPKKAKPKERKKFFTCGVAEEKDPPTAGPTGRPSVSASVSPTVSAASYPRTLWGEEDFAPSGFVSYLPGKEINFRSDSSAPDAFGITLSRTAFIGNTAVDDSGSNVVDVVVDVQSVRTHEHLFSGYESQLILFFAPFGTYAPDVDQDDNNFGEFKDAVVGMVRHKIYSSLTNPMDHTWFDAYAESASHASYKKRLTSGFSLRIRRDGGSFTAYYRIDVDDWVPIGNALPLPEMYAGAPLQIGLRVKKEWNAQHDVTVRATVLEGGATTDVPSPPSQAPTALNETWTRIQPRRDDRAAACPAASSHGDAARRYAPRGIGGGGAMAGLSISHLSDLWFVGTDMGTLFRSTDRGRAWEAVSHYETGFNARLKSTMPVGFTTRPEVLLFASCYHELSSTYPCVAQRSVDAGLTWTPQNVTGGSATTRTGEPVLDHFVRHWIPSLSEGSGYVLAATEGGMYRSRDDGATWSAVPVAHAVSDSPRGTFLDESVDPPYVVHANVNGTYMWRDGAESDVVRIWDADTARGGSLASFAGARSAATGRLTLAFVDSDATACDGIGHETDCGYVSILSEIISAEDFFAAESFDFRKTSQRSFRVVAAAEDAAVFYATGARSWPKARGTTVWKSTYNSLTEGFDFGVVFLQADVDNSYALWPADKLDYSAVGLDVGYWDAGYYTFAVNPVNSSEAGGSGNFFLHVTRNGGDNWESPFTDHADYCHSNGNRLPGQRWRSTGIEMTSVRWIKFNPHNVTSGFASVADIRMLRTLDGGDTFEISGGTKSGLVGINTLYDFAFASSEVIFGVGGNFHDWPHEWYKNRLRGAGGVFISWTVGTSWRRLGRRDSSNCSPDFHDVDCSLRDDMVRQVLSVEYDPAADTLYVGTQAAGVARLRGVGDILDRGGFVEELDMLQWEWINAGLGDPSGLIVPELKLRNGTLYCLLTGNAPLYDNDEFVGVYHWDDSNTKWIHHRVTVHHPKEVADRFELWAYPTSFDVDPASGTMWLVDLEANWNYLASGIWRSTDNGVNWVRVKQFTFPYHVVAVGDRVYASGGRSISMTGGAGWGDGGLLYSDDGGTTWSKNEQVPLLKNANSVAIDPTNSSMLFYTFFGGGMLHGPVPTPTA